MADASVPTPETAQVAPPEAAEESRRRSFEMPSPYSLLAIIIAAVAILTWIIPAGVFLSDEDGRPIPGSYTRVDGDPQGINDVLLAPVNGMYGLKSLPGDRNVRGEFESLVDQGTISVNNVGMLFGAIGVSLFIMVLGSFIAMSMKTGALTAGVAALGNSLQGQAPLLIAILTLVFALGGTSFGLADEIFGFVGLAIALLLVLGYDAMTAFAVVAVGAGVGRMAGTVNPFSVAVGSDAAGVSTGDGIILRLLLFVVLVGITIAYILRYAQRVKADPSCSIVAADREEHVRYFVGEGEEGGQQTALDGRQKLILAVFGLTFGILIFSVIPWDDLGLEFLPTLGWWFGEFIALFMVGAIIIGIIAGFSEKELTRTFVGGAADFLGPALLVALARGVTVIMHNGVITDTVLNWFGDILDGTSSAGFITLMYAFNVPLAFLIGSSSGQAALAVPILAPLADFAEVPRELVVTAFVGANATIHLISPTSAVLMGGLAIGHLGYGAYVRFVAPLLAILIVVFLVFIAVAAAVS